MCFDWCLCLCNNSENENNMPLLVSVPYVTYKISVLENLIKQLPPSPTKTQLLASVPVSCNYTIQSFGCKRCPIRRIRRIFGVHIRSYLTLKQHIQLFGLTSQCEVGVSHSIQEQLKWVVKNLYVV